MIAKFVVHDVQPESYTNQKTKTEVHRKAVICADNSDDNKRLRQLVVLHMSEDAMVERGDLISVQIESFQVFNNEVRIRADILK